MAVSADRVDRVRVCSAGFFERERRGFARTALLQLYPSLQIKTHTNTI